MPRPDGSSAVPRASRTGSPAVSRPQPLDRQAAENLARVLRVVADPTRLQLLSMIYGSSSRVVTVGEMASHLGLRQPTVSHHLRLMLEDGLVERHQQGRQVWYSLATDRRAAIADLLR